MGGHCPCRRVNVMCEEVVSFIFSLHFRVQFSIVRRWSWRLAEAKVRSGWRYTWTVIVVTSYYHKNYNDVQRWHSLQVLIQLIVVIRGYLYNEIFVVLTAVVEFVRLRLCVCVCVCARVCVIQRTSNIRVSIVSEKTSGSWNIILKETSKFVSKVTKLMIAVVPEIWIFSLNFDITYRQMV